MKKISLEIYDEISNLRIDKALSFFPEIKTRSRALLLLKESQVFLDGVIVKPSHKVKAFEIYEVNLPEEKSESLLTPYPLKLEILFEDQDLIVLNKPPGLVVHPSPGHLEKTLVHALLAHTKDLSLGFHETRPGIVHRLDKETSGLLLVAKTNEALYGLAEQFQSRKVKRIYQAFVFGRLKEKAGTFESYLARHPRDRKRFSSQRTSGKGKKAITHFKVLKEFEENISLLECQLETGRTHQIRVHLSEKEHPILGDEVYGGKRIFNQIRSASLKKDLSSWNRIALHASFVCFVHPLTQKTLTFEKPWREEETLEKVFQGFKGEDV